MEAAARDYYDVLGVERGADTTMLKQAFRAKARLLHPDVSDDPDAERKFRELAEAYSVLSGPASRMLYDRFGYRGRDTWSSPAAAQAVAGLLDFWAHAARRRRPAGAVAVVELGFYEAARGARRTVRYRGHGEIELEREVELSIPSGAEDGERLPLNGDDGAFAVLRVRPQPPDSTLLRTTAALGLLAAVGFLAFLFLG